MTDDPGESSFAEILKTLMERGLRAKGPSEVWSAKELSAALGFDDDRNVRNWIGGRNTPRDRAIWAKIEAAFFGPTDASLRHAKWRRELRESLLRETAPKPKPSAKKPDNLPYGSLGTLFKGRDDDLEKLDARLGATAPGQGVAIVGQAVHGLGGVGKTRLAIEYALRRRDAYCALFFLRAETPALLDADLALLAGPDVLALPEAAAREDKVKIDAVQRWLDANPGWLIIFDNVDNSAAAQAVLKLVKDLSGGHALLTGRLGVYPAGVKTLPLDVLGADAATAFLLERTQDKRDAAPDDEARARELAAAMGGLALALEQAGAFVCAHECSLRAYLALWRERRERVLNWFEPGDMSYNHDVGLAATWTTSVERLSAPARRLLERLAFLAPDAIPEFLLDRPVEGEDGDPHAALADLFRYSLASRAKIESGRETAPGFQVHRLVQDFSQRSMTPDRRDAALREALGWIAGAVGDAGDPQDVRAWPALDPLAPHALAVAERGDIAGIAELTAELLDYSGMLSHAKARYTAAESVWRRALSINEANLGPDHPIVAIRLNNLAASLRATNRHAKAELLMRRALAIDEASFGPDHSIVALRLNNLAASLRGMNRSEEAEPLLRRALAIDEVSLGPDHPKLGTRLNNLAELLRTMNRHAEAEPLFHRAHTIDEASFGQAHPNVARDLNNLAMLLHDTGRSGEAIPMLERAEAILAESYGDEHPHTIGVRANLAKVRGEG